MFLLFDTGVWPGYFELYNYMLQKVMFSHKKHMGNYKYHLVNYKCSMPKQVLYYTLHII